LSGKDQGGGDAAQEAAGHQHFQRFGRTAPGEKDAGDDEEHPADEQATLAGSKRGG